MTALIYVNRGIAGSRFQSDNALAGHDVTLGVVKIDILNRDGRVDEDRTWAGECTAKRYGLTAAVGNNGPAQRGETVPSVPTRGVGLFLRDPSWRKTTAAQ